jgi:alkylation response protein AidB-like acyl-CoA dehydrogenase
MGTLSGSKASEKVPAQIRLGQSAARVQMSEQLLAALVSTNMANDADRGAPLRRAQAKLHASMIADLCLDSVNQMARGVGGDGFRDGEPFQRYFRDLNVVTRHAFLDTETAGESYGKLLLGLTPQDPLI